MTTLNEVKGHREFILRWRKSGLDPVIMRSQHMRINRLVPEGWNQNPQCVDSQWPLGGDSLGLLLFTRVRENNGIYVQLIKD